MRIFLTGATGLVGRRLVIDRLGRGDRLVVLSRRGEKARKLFAADANPHVEVVEGNPAVPGPWQARIDGCDAVINLAGAGVADKRWTAAYKRTLVQSRVDSTHQVARAIASATAPPRVLISASAVGYYGDTGATETDESAEPGRDFLAELAVKWEGEAIRAESDRTRVARLRTGVVLDERGGILGKLLPLFRLGLGGRWGSGRQYLPWIHWRDVVGLVDLLLMNDAARGAVNLAAPSPAPVAAFARTLGRVLHRPAVLPAPTFALRLAVGEMASTMAASSRAVPARALELGYRFFHPELEPALRSLLDGDRREAPAPRVAPVVTGGAAPADAPRPAGPIRLVAVGVDGTLLRGDGRLAEGVLRACRAAQRAGCVIVPATSRPPRGMRSIAQALDLTGPMINYNGAVIWNPVENTHQHHQPLDGALAREIVADARRQCPALLVGVEALDRSYTDRIDRAFERDTGLVMEPDFIGDLDELFDRPVTRLALAGSAADIGAVRAMLSERYWSERRISLFPVDPHVLQVMHPLVDKGIALQRIAKRLGAERGQVMAIGDGDNDLGMIEWAGFGVAVANANPAAQRLADVIVPSNDDQGVARALQRYVLSGGSDGATERRSD